MTLRCIRCRKPLRAAAAQAGAYAWWPKCARKAGLLNGRTRAPRIRHEQPETDPRQMALELAA